jgi:AraC family transcriptional regulator
MGAVMGQSSNFVRSVGGELVSSAITNASSMRIEVLRRECKGRMHWHFRQPEVALFWFAKGAERLHATIEGHQVSCLFPGKSRFAVIPAETEIQGEWDVGPVLDYTVVFLNPILMSERLRQAITVPTIGFEHDGLVRNLAELCREASSRDDFFDLMAEGWAIQALAHISRVSEKCRAAPRSRTRGGLPGNSLRRIDDFVRANLGENISLDDLSAIGGLSKRHFVRAFQESIGTSPYNYVLMLRIEEAKQRLSRTAASITEIALATGFGQAQHFSTSFRKATGETPSSFRQRALS